MFKRANKITALLVAAASVMSLVPAMAADSTRLGTKDGTIESAIAYNGKYIYEGSKGDDSKAIYFNDGSKDKELTDFEDYDFTQGDDVIQTYGEKYMLAEDNNDYYLTDLSNGTITDDTLEDKKDSTASKLEKALSKTDKYDGTTVVAADLGNPVKFSASYQEPWYSVTKSHEGKTTTIFTDVNGKYVDSSVLANIYAYSSKRQEVVKIDKFDTEYKDTLLKVELVKQPQVIAQDKDNLYAIVNVNVTDNNQKSTAVAGNGQAEIDFSKAAIGTTQQVDPLHPGATEKYVIDTTQFTTTGQAVTVNGTKYTVGHGYTATSLANDLINTSLDGFTKTINTAQNVVTFTAKEAGDKTNLVSETLSTGATTVFTTPIVEGVNASYTAQAAKIRVAGNTYLYSATTDDATHYTSLATLKNRIIQDFTPGIAGYTFNPTTFVFTSTALGAKSVDDITTDLHDVKNVVAGTAAGITPTGKVTNAWYLQKISKAQGSTDEEASIPKEVKSFQMDTKALYDSGDVKDATDWLITDGAVNKFVNVEVKDNSLYAYKANSNNDNVKVLKLDLKQIKENPVDKVAFGTSKLDGYVVKKDGDTDQDFDAWSVDANGILWVLHDGKIIKFAEKDKTTTYTCDSGLDQLSVYDAKNLIAWSEDDERYTTVTEGTAVTAGEATAVAPVIVTGWVQDGANWSFNDATGAKVTNKWVNVGGAWYFLKTDGVMATGWYSDAGTWYYLKSSGAMATGWVNDGNAWYYLNASGAMLANTTVDGYVLNGSGAWVK